MRAQPYELTLKIPFVNEKQAEIAYNSLRVDKEPKRSLVEKQLSVEGRNLVATAGIPVASAPRAVRDVNPYMCTMKPLREGGPYHGQIVMDQGAQECRCCCKKDNGDVDIDKARLKWEQRRRRNFINKCCDGLLATPCCSVGSCSEIMNETREPAEFFVQCDCSKGKQREKKRPLKRRNAKRTVVPKQGKTSGCLCFDERQPIYSRKQVDNCQCRGDAALPPPSRYYGFENPPPERRARNIPPPDLYELVDELKCLVRELRAQRKCSERGFNDYRCMHQ